MGTVRQLPDGDWGAFASSGSGGARVRRTPLPPASKGCANLGAMTHTISNRSVGADHYPSQVERLNHKCRVTYNDFCRQPCAVCGLVMPPWAPPARVKVAHHRNPAEKKHSPSGLSRKGNEWWEVLVAELRKCEPLCANCHAVVHDLFDQNHYDADHLDYLQWDNLLALARKEVAQWDAPGIGHERP